MQLGVIARARGVRLLNLGEIDSTNEEARRLIETGERGPLWIVAQGQNSGRGRLGRNWVSPPGNLHASFVLSGFSDARVAPELGFVAGVAAIRALRAATGADRLQLKWPNDLQLDGAKLGGILLECLNAQTAPVAIIGIGVNVAQAPDGLPYPARALSALGSRAPSVETLFAHLSDSLSEALDIWSEGSGFARIREEWLSAAAALGDDISVAMTNETLQGRFDSIDGSGRLVLETRDGRRAIEAGDVLIGPRQPQGTCA